MSGVEKMEYITVRNATENNLKNITVSFPVNKFTCVTGPSGCGKSSLVYDTIYAESQRNFLEGMSGNLFDQKLMDKPAVDSIENLRPALNLSQNYYNVNPRSSVGTITDISYYLRTLFSFIYNYNYSQQVDMNFFSANNPSSCCHKCKGLGEEYVISEKSLVPDESKTLASGGILCYKGTRDSLEFRLLKALCSHFKIDINTKISDLTEEERYNLLYRDEGLELPLRYRSSNGKYRQKTICKKGAIPELEKKLEEIDRPSTFIGIQKFLKKAKCSACNGLKLRSDILDIKVCDYNISNVENLSFKQLLWWIETVQRDSNIYEVSNLISHLLNEMHSRVQCMIQLNLEYLSLGRKIPSLSKGELQRVRLANQLNCSLSGLIYILDEPCKGLHYNNIDSVINATKGLVKKGNTVLAIEHNRQYMSAADNIVEMGPKGGPEGGYIISKTTDCSTFRLELKFKKPRITGDFLNFKGITYHNLKNVNVTLPIGGVTCLTGVSGSGKTSISEVIEEVCLKGSSDYCRDSSEISKIKKVLRINQQPIGKTPRSTVVSYIGIYDSIREIFAQTLEAQRLHLKSSDFSMNVSGGRCECCAGTGKKKIELSYLPETFILCPECKGKRFKENVLSVQYNGLNINDILITTVDNLLSIFTENRNILVVLECLKEIGLGYLSLGQMSMNLSGGEAQRIKLAKQLSSDTHGTGLYILDEPTAGLNNLDIQKIEHIVNKLSKQGETVLIIDHNLEFIARIADYMIDLGCFAGEIGGRKLISGYPQNIVMNPESSWHSLLKEMANKEFGANSM